MLNLFLAFTSLNLMLQLVSLYFLSAALYQIKYQIKNKSVLTINEKGMMYHYLCFLIFLIATLIFYIEDMVAPPPQDPTVHTVTESFKILASALLQFSLSVVLYLLLKQQIKVNEQHMNRR